MNQQESLFPANYVKRRCLENHDCPRAHALIPDDRALRNWTAFLYFQKGMTMLFNGQEVGERHLPWLFEKDPVDWNSKPELTALMQKLYAIKQDPIFTNSTYQVKALSRNFILATHSMGDKKIYGIFSATGESGYISIDLPNGTYENLLGGTVDIYEGGLSVSGEPIVIKV